MFKSPNSRLSTSSKAVVSSDSFTVPMTLHSEARSSQASFEGLYRGFQEVEDFVSRLADVGLGIAVVGFGEADSPRTSRVEINLHGKDYRHDLTFALRCPIPKEHDFWARIRMITTVYDRLAELGATFQDRKGVELFLEESRLDQQKDEPEESRAIQK